MFIDETTIEVKAGDGGNGCYSHESLKYKPKGRPDGGDGGRGGNVYLAGSPQIQNLQDVAYRRHYKADRGTHGKGKNQTGRNGEDIVIPVPLGTIIHDADTGEIIADCLEEGKKQIVAQGGRGGKGNAALVTRRNPNPQYCQPGYPGEIKKIKLVLKVLADVGLVGRPNAGKSTFLSRVSHARPKIADYPFTTTQPNLGIVKPKNRPYGSSFVVADIPGLIEDCHKGKGLGIRFLKHIERTRVLAIMVEATSEDPIKDSNVLLEELSHYSTHLANKPKCFILTKSDLLSKENAPELPEGWLTLSAVTGENLETALETFAEMIERSSKEEAELTT
ncbi:MAG: GTPase ObgE [Chitinispirillaceae bacterium]